MAVQPIPEGYQALIPYVVAKDAVRLIDFLKQVFDARELSVSSTPDGVVRNAELKIADSVIMVAEAGEHYPARPATIYMYVNDVDAYYDRALAHGASSIMPPMDQFYGDRSGGVLDQAGNHWWLATRIENLTADEVRKRMSAMSESQS